MKRVEKPQDLSSQSMNIIVVLQVLDGGMLFLYSPTKHWHLPRIQMRADDLLGEFNQLFTELGLPTNLITENLQGIIDISTLPGVKSPFSDSDAVWLYLCPTSNLNLSGQYHDYKWLYTLSELNSLGVPDIYSEIFKRFEHFKLREPKPRKNLFRRWFMRRD